jgi:hypothetical protein
MDQPPLTATPARSQHTWNPLPRLGRHTQARASTRGRHKVYASTRAGSTADEGNRQRRRQEEQVCGRDGPAGAGAKALPAAVAAADKLSAAKRRKVWYVAGTLRNTRCLCSPSSSVLGTTATHRRHQESGCCTLRHWDHTLSRSRTERECKKTDSSHAQSWLRSRVVDRGVGPSMGCRSHRGAGRRQTATSDPVTCLHRS